MAGLAVKVAAASHIYPGETENGDAWVVDYLPNGCRIAVIDGIGHGPLAAKASAAGVDVLHAHPDLGTEEALELCHRALMGTRGAAISIAVIDLASARLTYAGIGNVDGQLWQEERSRRFTPDRGIVGAVHGSIRPVSFPLSDHWRFLLYSDGISSRFGMESFSDEGKREPLALADLILERWGRERDDATIVAAFPIAALEDRPDSHPRGSKG